MNITASIFTLNGRIMLYWKLMDFVPGDFKIFKDGVDTFCNQMLKGFTTEY